MPFKSARLPRLKLLNADAHLMVQLPYTLGVGPRLGTPPACHAAPQFPTPHPVRPPLPPSPAQRAQVALHEHYASLCVFNLIEILEDAGGA